jgi:hypothetical protein
LKWGAARIGRGAETQSSSPKHSHTIAPYLSLINSN